MVKCIPDVSCRVQQLDDTVRGDGGFGSTDVAVPLTSDPMHKWGKESLPLDVAQQEYDWLRDHSSFTKKDNTKTVWKEIPHDDQQRLNEPLKVNAPQITTYYANQKNEALAVHTERGAQSSRTHHGTHDKSGRTFGTS